MLVNLFACKGDYGNSSIAYAFSNLVNKPVIATPYSVSFSCILPRIGGDIFDSTKLKKYGLGWYSYQGNNKKYKSKMFKM